MKAAVGVSITALALVAFAAGALSHRSGLLGRIASIAAPDSGAPMPLGAVPAWKRPFVLVVAGQSNAANHGTPPARSGAGTFALAEGGLYPLVDPLPGASGSGGSPWSRWAALRRADQPDRDVIVAAVAQGSSAVADWVGNGPHAQRLAALLPQLRRTGLRVDAVVWHQGETEAWGSHADGDAYRKGLQHWINSVRALGISAPIFICLTSRDGSGVINPTIRAAQASVWDARRQVFAGVDTDSLGDAFRSDGVHFNGRGLDQFARLLEQALQRRSASQAVSIDGP